MQTIENTPERLVLKSGGTMLTLDKSAGKAIMQRKLLFWSLKPLETPLSDVAEVTVDADVDRASGVDVCSTTLVKRDGGAWALSADDKKDAETTAATMRSFLGLAH